MIPIILKPPSKARLRRIELEKLAKQGDIAASDKLKRRLHVKVYTDEELQILNSLICGNWECVAGEIVDIKHLGKHVMLTDYDGNFHQATLDSIQHFKDNYYIATLTYKDALKKEKQTKWIVKSDKNQEFIPMFCISNWPIKKKGGNAK